MRKIYRIVELAPLMCVLILGTSWGADASLDAGAKIYTAKCVACHAKDGKGNAAMVKVFKLQDPALLNLTSDTAQKHTDAELVKTTTDGLNKMPAYKGKLTDTEISEAIAYVRTLVKKQ